MGWGMATCFQATGTSTRCRFTILGIVCVCVYVCVHARARIGGCLPPFMHACVGVAGVCVHIHTIRISITSCCCAQCDDFEEAWDRAA